MTLRILALGGDGIGPEVVDAALNLDKMTWDLDGMLSIDAITDAMSDTRIEQFHEQFGEL